jgi:glycosyltransferase involved in cell wall biosynthesis
VLAEATRRARGRGLLRRGLRALIVVPHLLDSGPTRFVLDLAAGLLGLGIDTEVFCVSRGDPQCPDPTIPHVDPLVPITYGAPPSWRLRYWLPTMVAKLVQAAASADVVVAGNEVGPGLTAAFIAGKVTRKPVAAVAQCNLIASLRTVGGWHKRAAELAYPRFDAVVCVSRGLLPTAAALGVPAQRARVIRNGIDVQRVAALASEPAPGWLPGGPLVVGLGRLHRQKGFDLLIEAHAAVRATGRPHRLVIIGEGEERGGLEALAARLGVSDSTYLPGFIRNPFPIVARAALFCLPSRFEGDPLALVEALSLGVPLIAADCVAGPSEILDGGRYGDLVEVDSLDGLASRIARHLDEPQVLAAKARAGKERRENFSVQASAYATLFEAMVERRVGSVTG